MQRLFVEMPRTYTGFAPLGFAGISAAAASIFFAYVGFDAVSTAAEETKNPQRNMPIGLIGSLAICTIFYLLVAAGVIGSVGAQPVFGTGGETLAPGSTALAQQCAAIQDQAVVCSKEALAWTLREIGWPQIGNLIGLAAGLALPSVILILPFGQTRIFFVMARDGLLPRQLGRVHEKSGAPVAMTIITGVVCALIAGVLPLATIAELANAGTLAAFIATAAALMILRVREPNRARPFKTPAPFIVAPAAILGCLYLFFSLPSVTQIRFFIWMAAGLVVYFVFSRGSSVLSKQNAA